MTLSLLIPRNIPGMRQQISHCVYAPSEGYKPSEGSSRQYIQASNTTLPETRRGVSLQ